MPVHGKGQQEISGGSRRRKSGGVLSNPPGPGFDVDWAAIAQGCAPADPGRLITRVRIAASGSLVATPPPLVACEGSSTEVALEAALEADAALDWSEVVVLGRSAENAGGVLLSWHVSVDGRPLLLQSVDIRDPAMLSWPGMIQRRRVVATRLIVGDPHEESPLVPRTVVRSPFAVAQQLNHRAVLLSVLASDALTAGFELGELARAIRPKCSRSRSLCN